MELSSSLVLVLVLAVLMLVKWKRKASGLSLPPGPLALPLVGNLPIMDKSAPFKSFMKWSKTYGPVMTVHIGLQRTVVLVGYDTVKEALVDQADDFKGRAPVPLLNRVLRGYGLAISNGDRWQQLRRFTLTTLRDFGMGRKQMEQWIQEESRHLLNSFDETKSTPVDPTFFMSRAVSNVICSLVFGQRFDYEDKNFLHLLQIISRLVRFGSSPWGQMYNIFPKLMEFLSGRHHAMFREVEDIKAFIMTKIKEHEQNVDFSDPKDFIDCFLIRLIEEKHNPDTEFHKDNMLGTVLNLFVAGTETTSTTIRYALMLLIKYPHIQEQMQREIDRVIGQNRIPNMDDRKSLPFTDAVIHEVQRYMDIVPLNFPHYATHDISFRGYVIPKVTMNTYNGQLLLSWKYFPMISSWYVVLNLDILCNFGWILFPQDTVILPMLHSVLRDEGQWETPWTFNPEHFLDANGNFKKNPAFFAFSAGKRSCVGESLARMELFLFIVSLLQKFSFSSPKGPDGIDPSPELSSFGNMPRFYDLIASPR
ncbi:cytochrome P450 2G1-like isoform X1 [Ctenopharyngodon idella]|uniref:cytochrome P450 2G1-like isoform X1 n=1 Tax=Ctenopharyngodon idella TaxID=7959 RepID=UPI00222F1A43|nr:cytochrome P450 2G1-like isoform X1 [Ctenopharyngodon idella]